MSSTGRVLKNGNHWGIIILSLIPTPLLIFISSSSALYLRNQRQLQYRPEVLIPFAALFILTVILGLALQAFSRYRPARFCLAGYYALGPLFLLFVFIRNQLVHVPFMDRFYNTIAGLLIFPGSLLVATVFLYLWFHPRKIAKISAALGALLLIAEAFSFYSNFDRRVPNRTGSLRETITFDPDRSLPNIYHITLDGFQTDFFEQALTPELKEMLAGFTYYPSNRSIYHTTFMSMASVFTGREFVYDRLRNEYVEEMYNGRASFLYWLKKTGYTTVAYLPEAQTAEVERAAPPESVRWLDYSVFHDLQVTDELIHVNTTALWNLWLYSMLPDPLRDAVGRGDWFTGLDMEDLRLLQRQRLLSRSAQAISYLGFQNVLSEEKALPESNRYTYIHLLIPHWPFNLRPDCSFRNDGKTGPIEQSQCALKLIEDFVNLLKSLDRFDRSLILIHGDHGAFYRVKDNVLTSGSRSRSQLALLLFKPFGAAADQELATSTHETTLLDIKPALMWTVAGNQSNGSASDESPPIPGRQTRLVPYIEGETLPAAKRILLREGFSPGRVLTTHSPVYAAGKVIAQDPSPYDEAGALTQVAILLSRGTRDNANLMPDFVGRQITEIVNEVIERTRRGSFPVSRIRYIEHGGAQRGAVVAQTPTPGTEINESHRIELYVSKGQ